MQNKFQVSRIRRNCFWNVLRNDCVGEQSQSWAVCDSSHNYWLTASLSNIISAIFVTIFPVMQLATLHMLEAETASLQLSFVSTEAQYLLKKMHAQMKNLMSSSRSYSAKENPVPISHLERRRKGRRIRSSWKIGEMRIRILLSVSKSIKTRRSDWWMHLTQKSFSQAFFVSTRSSRCLV